MQSEFNDNKATTQPVSPQGFAPGECLFEYAIRAEGFVECIRVTNKTTDDIVALNFRRKTGVLEAISFSRAEAKLSQVDFNHGVKNVVLQRTTDLSEIEKRITQHNPDGTPKTPELSYGHRDGRARTYFEAVDRDEFLARMRPEIAAIDTTLLDLYTKHRMLKLVDTNIKQPSAIPNSKDKPVP